MDRSFSRITFLEYRLKAAEAEVSAFKSGKKYQKIHEVHRKEVKALEQEIPGPPGHGCRPQPLV